MLKNSYRSSILFCAELALTCSRWDWGKLLYPVWFEGSHLFGQYCIKDNNISLVVCFFSFLFKLFRNQIKFTQCSHTWFVFHLHLLRFQIIIGYFIIHYFVFHFSRIHNIYAVFIVFKNIFVTFFVDKWGCI